MKRIDKQVAIATAAQRLATQPFTGSITAGDKAFVRGAPFNLVGLVLAEAQKDVGDKGRLVFPRKMNDKSSGAALGMALGVKTDELSDSLQLAISRLESFKEPSDAANQALKDFATTLQVLVGRAPGRPGVTKPAENPGATQL